MPRAADPFGVVADRGVYLPDADGLVVADLHLGLTAPVDAPLAEGPRTVDRLVGLVDRFDPATVVLAGDVLHAFGRVPREAKATLDAIRSAVASRSSRLVVVEGNHDAQLAPLIDDPPVAAHELGDGTVVCHGHEPPAVDGRRYLAGHDHPAIEIDGRRRPCFLYGPGAYDGADVLALPAFNPGVAGTAVNTWVDGDALSPLLAASSSFHPVVWDPDRGESLVFPALADLSTYL